MNKFIDDYLGYLKIDRKYSENTISSYFNALSKYQDYLDNNNLNFMKVRVEDIYLFIEYLNTINSSRSVSYTIGVIKNFYNFLI